MEEKVVRKTTARKSVRKTSIKVAPTTAVVRKTTASVSARKAPPRLSTTSKKRSPLVVIVLGVVLFGALIGVSAMIGLSDKGELDVASAIAKRKEKATPEERQALENVPTEQIQPSAPNGGLVGMGQPPPPVVQQPVSTTSQTVASTSKATTASSSEIVPTSKNPVSNDT